METTKESELYTSLVGSSIEFRFSKAEEKATALDKNLIAEREKISASIELAFGADVETCIVLLAEILNYYMKQSYYMAVRSSITLRRMRPRVLDYLKETSVEKRASRLQKLLENRDYKYRDALLEAVRYFTSVYSSRLKDFKYFLSREELLMVA